MTSTRFAAFFGRPGVSRRQPPAWSGGADAVAITAKFSLRRKIQGLQRPWRVSSDANTHRDEQLDLL